jgi:hypothetical protein
MREPDSTDKALGLYFDMSSRHYDFVKQAEKLSLQLALAVIYLHQGLEDDAAALLDDIYILGKHPYALDPKEVAYLRSIVEKRAVPE